MDEPESCDGVLPGPALDQCKKGAADGGGGGASDGGSTLDSLDPMQALADACQEGAAWVVEKLGSAVSATGDVDFANAGFVRTYAIVFGASTFMVLMVWLWGVTKRAVRGVPLTTALGEAIGLLWLAVGASAFTPLILHTVVAATDSVTDGITGARSKSPFFADFAEALKDGVDGGPILQIIVSLLVILAAGVLWLEMTVRAALLYVGAMLGTLVYSGLVERELWGKVKRWAGIMLAIILLKPILVIVLALASALTAGEGPGGGSASAVISGVAILVIAIIASSMIFALVPGMGDDIVNARRNAYDPASRQSLGAVTKPVNVMRQGINTHAARDQSIGAASAASHAQQSGGGGGQASAGMAAHGSRRPTAPTPRQQPQQDQRGDDRRE